MHRLSTIALALVAVACAAPSPPPAALVLDPFYTRHLDAGGVPVVSSNRAPPEALRIARDIVVAMLAHRPDLHAQIVTSGARVAVMASDEGTLDLPEQRDWRKPPPGDPRLTRCERKHYQERIGRLSDRE